MSLGWLIFVCSSWIWKYAFSGCRTRHPWGVYFCSLGYLWPICTFTNSFLAPTVRWWELCPGRQAMRQVLAMSPSTGVSGALINLSDAPPLCLATLTIMLVFIQQILPADIFPARHCDRVEDAETKWILFPILNFPSCLERSHRVCPPNWNGDLNLESSFGPHLIEVYIARAMVDSSQ